MGMESGSIFDFQLDASSFRNDELSPAKARLDSDTAWVPSRSDKDPYIQVQYPKNHNPQCNDMSFKTNHTAVVCHFYHIHECLLCHSYKSPISLRSRRSNFYILISHLNDLIYMQFFLLMDSIRQS